MSSRFSMLLSFSFLVLCALGLHAQETDKAEDVGGGEPSLQTDALYTLQQQYKKEKSGLFAPYAEKLKAFLDAKLADAEKLYTEKKKHGNIKGMALATKAKTIYSKALEELKEKNDFSLPSNVRKELRDDIAACKTEKKKVLAEAKEQAAALKEKYKASFAELYKALYAEGEPKSEEIDRRYKEFLTTEIQPPEKPDEPTSDAASSEDLKELGVENEPQQKEEHLDPIIATKGDGVKWADVGTFTANMMGMDVVDLPLAGKKAPFTWTQFSPIANADSQLKYAPLHELPQNPELSFRLKRVPGRGAVEVMSWPSEKNSWTLTFRTERSKSSEKEYPLKRGFILQVSLPGGGLEAAFGANCLASSTTASGTAPKKSAQKVLVKIFTRPEKAKVYINGQVYAVKGKPVLTPCKAPMPTTGCEVKLHILGFLPKTYANYKPGKGAFIKAVLQKDPSIKVYQKKVAASAKTWTNSKVALNPGDRVILKIEGKWSCASTKDKCGPEGIPNDLKHYKYYADASNDLREESKYPYGALLMRIGEDGSVRHVPRRELQFIVRKKGELFFNINEREGKPRKNNKSQLDINIMIKVKK